MWNWALIFGLLVLLTRPLVRICLPPPPAFWWLDGGEHLTELSIDLFTTSDIDRRPHEEHSVTIVALSLAWRCIRCGIL